MKRTIVVVVLVAGGLIAYRTRSKPTHLPVGEIAGDSSIRDSTPSAAPSRTHSVDHVTKLATAEERRAIADRIASAQTARGSTHAPAAPHLPAEAEINDSLKVSIRSAMHEALPFLAQCYQDALPTLATPDLTLHAKLTLTGDPDVGTLIDAHELVDQAGAPLPAKLDDCLRSAMQSLELPPLAEGDVVSVTYPFVFRND